MAKQNGWDRRKAETRLSLATAAAKLIRKNGFDATTVDDIAREAGASPATFFRYFETKEDVLFFEIRALLDQFRDRVTAPADGRTSWQQIRQGFTATAEQFAARSEELEEAAIVNWLHEPAINRRVVEYAAELDQIMAASFAAERGVDAAADVVSQVLARSVSAVYLSAFHVHIVTREPLIDLLNEGFDLMESQLRIGQAAA